MKEKRAEKGDQSEMDQEPSGGSGQDDQRQQWRETSRLIAEQLGESAKEPKALIYNAVRILGREQALAYLQQALEIEAGGGLMLPDQSRRRTAGGVFFFLIKRAQPYATNKHIFWQKKRGQRTARQKKKRQEKGGVSSPSSVTQSLFWADRLDVLRDLEKGKATAVKMTLIGKPGTVAERGQCLVISMDSPKVPTLPKGLPEPPTVTTTYTAYVAVKQWRKVAEALAQDAEDVVILEGWPQLDLETQTIAVFVTNATTKQLQAAQRKHLPPPQ